MNYIKNNIILLSIILLLVISNVSVLVYYNTISSEECSETSELAILEDNPIESEEEVKNTITVDIKGYVKKPGVYVLEEGAIVNDLINAAGGLKTNATTDNINLSKTLINEAMVIISSKSQLSSKTTNASDTSNSTTSLNKTESNQTSTTTSFAEETESFATIESPSKTTSDSSTSSTNNGKISINTATKEELMTLNGIGESKANNIIEYRKEHPFTKIEDIKNVSGIGDAAFEKIKDNITI